MHVGLNKFDSSWFRNKIFPVFATVSDVKTFGGTDTKLSKNHEYRINMHDEVRIEMFILFRNSKEFLD